MNNADAISTTPKTENTAMAPPAPNIAPPAAAPAAIPDWTPTTTIPPALSALSGTVLVAHVDHATETPPNAKPHNTTKLRLRSELQAPVPDLEQLSRSVRHQRQCQTQAELEEPSGDKCACQVRHSEGKQ